MEAQFVFQNITTANLPLSQSYSVSYDTVSSTSGFIPPLKLALAGYIGNTLSVRSYFLLAYLLNGWTVTNESLHKYILQPEDVHERE